MKKWFKRMLWGTIIVFGLSLASLVCAKWWIYHTTRHQVYRSIEQVPYNRVGLVLGTSKRLKGGHLNPYFAYRIQAAAALYQQGKINHIIVSGDNSEANYNEPKDMQMALIRAGVPECAITLDCAGFRTLDSVVRCKKVFGQQKFTIISQPFHDYRALYISKQEGIDAIAFAAKDVSKKMDYKTPIREIFACLKAVLDTQLLHTKPKFIGAPIPIPDKIEKGGA